VQAPSYSAGANVGWVEHGDIVATAKLMMMQTDAISAD
jgi:hypothetical protein